MCLKSTSLNYVHIMVENMIFTSYKYSNDAAQQVDYQTPGKATIFVAAIGALLVQLPINCFNMLH